MSCAPNTCRTISFSPVGLCSSWRVSPIHGKGKGTLNSITTCDTGHWSLLQSPCTNRPGGGRCMAWYTS